MKRSSANKRPRGRPKKSPSLGAWCGEGDPNNSSDCQMERDREVYLFVQLSMKAAGAKSMSKAVAAAAKKFHKDRSTIYRKIAPFLEAKQGALKMTETFNAAAANARGTADSLNAQAKIIERKHRETMGRLASVFTAEELEQLGGATLSFALKLADEREELRRLRKLVANKSASKD